MATYKSTTFPFYILLFLLWISVQAFFFLNSSIKISVDTEMYLQDAESLLAGTIPQQRSIWYLGYSSFLAIIFYLGGSLFHVVLAQILFSGTAAILLYQYLQKISHSHLPAFTGVLLYLGWIKIHEWNVFIYTESLFTSFCIITFVLLTYSKKLWQVLLVTPLIIFTFLIRPTGIGFLFSLLVYYIHIFRRKRPQLSQTYFLAAAIILFLPALLLVNKMLQNYTLIESYAKAEIIYPNISLGILQAKDIVIPDEEYPSLLRLVIFIFNNPLYFLKLSFTKFFLFFGNIKPYFSLLHNTLISLFLFPVYYFAVKGFYLFPGKAEERSFILSFILVQALIVTLTTENWDGRFLIPVLPFVFIFATFGLQALLFRLRAWIK